MKDYLELIDDDTPGPRNDVTPLFADADGFAALLADICDTFSPDDFDLVAGIDALGFVLGAAVAVRCGKGFLAIRKGGKLPVETVSRQFVDYSGEQKSLEVRTDAIRPGTRILLVDEWVETGTQLSEAAALIETLDGVVAGIATLNMDENEKTGELIRRYRVFDAWNS